MDKGYSSQGCLVCGRANLHGLQAVFRINEEGAWSEVCPPRHLQGFDGTLHGGVIAAILDDAMWYTAHAKGFFTMTAELLVRYKHPVPTGQPIRVQGRLDSHRGRLIELSARLTDSNGTVLAEGRGKFLCVPEGVKLRLGGDGIIIYEGDK